MNFENCIGSHVVDYFYFMDLYTLTIFTNSNTKEVAMLTDEIIVGNSELI